MLRAKKWKIQKLCATTAATTQPDHSEATSREYFIFFWKVKVSQQVCNSVRYSEAKRPRVRGSIEMKQQKEADTLKTSLAQKNHRKLRKQIISMNIYPMESILFGFVLLPSLATPNHWITKICQLKVQRE